MKGCYPVEEWFNSGPRDDENLYGSRLGINFGLRYWSLPQDSKFHSERLPNESSHLAPTKRKSAVRIGHVLLTQSPCRKIYMNRTYIWDRFRPCFSLWETCVFDERHPLVTMMMMMMKMLMALGGIELPHPRHSTSNRVQQSAGCQSHQCKKVKALEFISDDLLTLLL